MFLSILLVQTSSAQLTFQGRACSGNSVCDVIRSCNADGCTSSFENCQACPSTTKTCPSGPLRVPSVCVDSGTPQCRDASASATCPSGPPSGVGEGEPYTVLTFTVFTKKNLVITVAPQSQTTLAGKTLNYKATVENKNPKQLTFQLSSQVPEGWQINMPATLSVAANGKAEVSFRVTSSETASDAGYPIIIGMFNSELNLFGTATATYVVASRGSPTVSAAPKSQPGYPGQPLFYNISVTNNDPAEFDASSISLRASTPDGFKAVFTPGSITVKPGATEHVRLDVTSPGNATEASYAITVNATANRLTATEFIEYKIDFCGDSVCQQGEEGSTDAQGASSARCAKDCPSDPSFSCSGRCEREVDDGLEFSAKVSIPYNKFIVCSRNSSLSACAQAAGKAPTGAFPGININGTNTTANCGIGKPCLCTSSSIAACKALCVDNRGVYYLAASTGNSSVRGLVNWSYACPFVDLPEIKALRESFASARNEYEKAQSALRESLSAPNMTLQRKSEIRPCIDALSGIISDARDYVAYLDAVIAWPGISNTTAARLRTASLRTGIESTYNTYCRGASGLLQLGLSIPQLEKGETGQLIAALSNIGGTPYYGYVQCDLTGAAGEKQQQNSTCGPISGQSSAGSGLDVNASSAGRWSARCRAFGSLLPDCSLAAVHSEAAVQFNVSTREAFVVDVTGSCAGNLTCAVRGSQGDCVGCRVSNNAQSASASSGECTLISSNGTSRFSCPKSSYGNHTLFGYSLDNDRCKPVQPQEKNISVRCPGCGDGAIDAGEQCELPYSNNNQRCTQTQSTCEGKLFGLRDAAGFCSAGCLCSYDQYEFSCTRGQCGAECEDGETRTVTINGTGGSCACVQQCSSGCAWNPCDCEAGTGTGTTGTGTGTTGTGASGAGAANPPSVQVSHSLTGATATLTATAANATDIEIYVDGLIVRSCQSSPCTLTASYSPGVHTYFGRAVNPVGTDTDPDQGTKSFTIPTTAANQTSNGTTTTTGSGMSLNISHSPQNPTASDMVTITASGSNTDSMEIYVDGFVANTCNSSPCTYENAYPAGTHTYFALAFDAAGNSISNPASGTRSFVVRSTLQNQTSNQTTTTSNGLSLTLSHFPQNPTTLDSVVITASGSINADRIEIYADGFLAKSCTEFVCSLANRYSAGQHTYFALAFDGSVSVANPLTGTKSFAVTQSAVNETGGAGGNGTGGLGTTNIILDISHNPQSITTQDAVTLTAIAHGPRSFREVSIFIDGALRKTCTNVPSSQPCTFRSTFPEGSHDYFAAATDVTNSSARDPQSGSESFFVSPPAPAGPAPPPGGPFIGSGQTPPSTSAGGTGRCYAKITDRNCTYNSATRRYDLRIAAIWDNGTHAHWEIDGTPGKKIYTKNFTHVEPLSAPGMKSVKAEVHNVNDSLLCLDSSEVYCGPGSTSGKDLDLIIDVRDVVKTGLIDVRVIVAPYMDINALRLQNYVESPLNVSSVRLEGNSSLAGISGPVRVAEDKTYTLYTATTNLMAGKNVSLLYKLRIDEPGEYKLMAIANYSGTLRVTKTIKATNCPQAFEVLAVSQDGSLCLPYTTPCDVPPGWIQVERCPDEAPPQEESSILPLIILIII
ncbi:MAG: hypothetical protein HY519_00670, partial [Candidatus Aenigmarchaeota archaeon]|nr:hypothetical protein [Candidatus Aenigmarchaeota archaeon]